jgi:subtilisin-like proprotein convertase family protein
MRRLFHRRANPLDLRLWLTLAMLLFPAVLWGQSGQFGDFLRRLDRNGDGMIDPREISDRERSFLERFASGVGIRMSEPVSVRRLEEAAREYERRRSNDDDDDRRRSVRSPQIPLSPVAGFGSEEGVPLVPGFDLGETKYAYTSEDVRQAESRLRSDDRNRDGAIDRLEARQSRWSESDPFVYDFNADGRLSLIELTQRYAKRRLDDEDDDRRDDDRRDNDRRDNDRDGGADSNRQREPSGDDARRDGNNAALQGFGRNEFYLAASVIGRHDVDRNGRLERERGEWAGLGANAGDADVDRDGQITREELAAWLFVEVQKRAREVPPEELPQWFVDLDANQDGQVSMVEFAREWTDEKAEEFIRLDGNNDGFVTRLELLAARASVAGTFANTKARVLLPRTTLVAEIDVEDDYLIDDLDVQLSITHTSVDDLDAYLIGPDGQRIELFTAVGGNDDHFDGTILDDEATAPISTGRAPFQGRFQPEALDIGEPSLRHYRGQSVRGLWQLMIRTSRSDRSGMLHGWSLIVKPQSLEDWAE